MILFELKAVRCLRKLWKVTIPTLIFGESSFFPLSTLSTFPIENEVHLLAVCTTRKLSCGFHTSSSLWEGGAKEGMYSVGIYHTECIPWGCGLDDQWCTVLDVGFFPCPISHLHGSKFHIRKPCDFGNQSPYKCSEAMKVNNVYAELELS